MNPRIEYATEADGPGLANVNIISFRHQGLLQMIFPEASEERLGEYKAVYSMKHLANPEMHVLKLVEPATGEIIGYSRWHIPKALVGETLPVLSEKAQEAARDFKALAPRPMNEEMYAAFRQLLETSRKRFTTEQDMGKSSVGLSFCLIVFCFLLTVAGCLIFFISSGPACYSP